MKHSKKHCRRPSKKDKSSKVRKLIRLAKSKRNKKTSVKKFKKKIVKKKKRR